MIKIQFIYLYGKQTIEFNINHYISIFSNICVNNAEASIWTNDIERLKNNYWIKMLQSEYKLDIKDIHPIYEAIENRIDLRLDKLPYMAHVADMCRLYIMANNPGIYSDVDSIAVNPIPEELLNYNYVFCLESNTDNCLCNGFFIANRCNFLLDWLDDWETYSSIECEPGTPNWTKYSVQLGWTHYLNYKHEVTLIDSISFQPKYLTYKDTCELFFLDRYDEIKNNPNIYQVHLWETRNQSILKVLDERYFKESKATYAQLGSPYV